MPITILTRKGRTGMTIRTQKAATAKGMIKSVVQSTYEALLAHDVTKRYISLECRNESTNDVVLEVTIAGHNLRDEDRDKIAEAQDETLTKSSIAAILRERMSTYAKQMEDLAPHSEQLEEDIESHNVAMGCLMATRTAWDAIIGSSIPAPTREELLA